MPTKPKKEEAPEDDLAPLGGDEDGADEDDLDLAADDDDGDDDDDALIEVPVTAAGKASAARLLELLVEKGGLALSAKKPGAALIEQVARVLEAPGSLSSRATRLSDAIVDSDDVDDLFVDDDTLAELLKRW